MEDSELVLVLEVPPHKKILCQAKGCGHAVFRRVHVIRQRGELGVFGSSCAKKLLGEKLKRMRPTIGGQRGVTLSELDVDLLRYNTIELIAKLQKNMESESGQHALPEVDYRSFSDTQLEKVCLERAKKEFRAKRGLDPDAPGWVGWVKMDAKKLFKKLRDQ